eukprot:g60882.t1
MTCLLTAGLDVGAGAYDNTTVCPSFKRKSLHSVLSKTMARFMVEVLRQYKALVGEKATTDLRFRAQTRQGDLQPEISGDSDG